MAKIASEKDQIGQPYDFQMEMTSQAKFREYVSAHDERLKSELRAKRKRSPKQAGHPMVDGFMEKVRMQD